ncbi:MAG: signal peptidase I [Lachnospiraceae bacterium]|nr:signal peptidase I [Lachnospiraceae bacterium]
MNKLIRGILEFLIYTAGVLLGTYLIIHFIGQRTEVIGTSMVPTLEDGDQLIVEKISYRFHDPERYDIIVFPFHYAEKTYFVKRIIGLPGERVRIDFDGTLYINGEAVDDGYGREVMIDPGIAAVEITLADDEYFVLGDNRNNSQDSRDPAVGPIKRSELIGRVFTRIWPFSRFGSLYDDRSREE